MPADSPQTDVPEDVLTSEVSPELVSLDFHEKRLTDKIERIKKMPPAAGHDYAAAIKRAEANLQVIRGLKQQKASR